MFTYLDKKRGNFVTCPTNKYAFYVDYILFCVYYYYNGDRHDFLESNRLEIARSQNVTWERIQIKLVDNVNGLAPTSLVADSLTELSVIDMESK